MTTGFATMDDLTKLFREKYSPEYYDMFDKAYDFACHHHEGQLRASGEPYIVHPVAVCRNVIEMGMDVPSVIAALLHDTVEDCNDVTLKDIEAEFGLDIATLVDGVTKLTITGEKTHITEKQEQAENLRKLFLAIAADVRVVIIKLADRLHNMRTLSYCDEFKQRRISKETLDVYAPLADRFGMGAIKGELEDLSFRYLMPLDYKHIKREFQKQQKEREVLLNNAMDEIGRELKEAGIKASISGRPKHLYSIYRKMQRINCNINEVYDLIAIRIIVDSINDCYAALGIIHANWKPLPGRFKDYIASPKPNMYQSLHTTLLGDNMIPFEVQIRTTEMHRAAEYGIAAHWMYKEGREIQTDLDKRTSWLREAIAEKEEAKDSTEFVDSVLNDFLGEYVFVLSPKGEIFDLPKGSTPLDFAYRIHTNIGHHTQRAKVNGNIVRLDYKLQTNDVVDIITSSSQPGPKLDWINIVKTQSAKNKIKQWFKKENREENIVRGKDQLNEICKKKNLTLSDFEKPEIYEPILRRFTMSTIDDLYASVGYGGITAQRAFHNLESKYKALKAKEEAADLELVSAKLKTQSKPKKKDDAANQSNGVIIHGLPGMSVRFGNCCNPLPGDSIIGYITRGRGVSVHKKDCPNIASLKKDEDRLIDVEWTVNQSSSFDASIQIHTDNKPGTFLEISAILSSLNINIQQISGKPTADGNYIIDMRFPVHNTAQLEEIMKKIKQLKCVHEIYRLYHR